MNLLRAVGVTKRYPGVTALRGVDFDLRPGEVHALIGENGAGKSTLIKLLSGAERPDEGRIEVDGRPVALSPDVARGLGVAVIHQHPALFSHLSVAENLAVGLEPAGLWRRIDWRGRRARARELLMRVGATLEPDTPCGRLSVAERQRVAIAGALGCRARALILDEPTACLPDRDVERLHELVRELKAEGVGLIYITHRLEELPALADRVTVLRDGEAVATRPLSEVDAGELIRFMVGRPVEVMPRGASTARPEVVLAVEGLTCVAAGLRDITFDLRAGEILGLAGLVGSGRSELARTLFGITPADSGTVRLEGREVSLRSPREAIARGLAYVPEDRRRHGVIGAMSTVLNTSLAALERVSRAGFLQPAAERALARPLTERLRVKTPDLDTPVGTLSGGNQQKVALARWLATDARVLIVDEPTQGIDVGAKVEVHALLGELAAEGRGVLLISSELPEVLALADRVAVMAGGSIVAILDRAEATPDAVMNFAFGRREAVA